MINRVEDTTLVVKSNMTNNKTNMLSSSLCNYSDAYTGWAKFSTCFVPRRPQCYRFCANKSQQNLCIFRVTESIVNDELNPCSALLNNSCRTNVEVVHNSCQHLCRNPSDFSSDAFFQFFTCPWIACIHSFFQITPKKIVSRVQVW